MFFICNSDQISRWHTRQERRSQAPLPGRRSSGQRQTYQNSQDILPGAGGLDLSPVGDDDAAGNGHPQAIAGGDLTVSGGSFDLDTADDAVHSGADVTITGGSESGAGGMGGGRGGMGGGKPFGTGIAGGEGMPRDPGQQRPMPGAAA